MYVCFFKYKAMLYNEYSQNQILRWHIRPLFVILSNAKTTMEYNFYNFHSPFADMSRCCKIPLQYRSMRKS